MAIIRNKKNEGVCSIKAKITPEMMEQIESYCHWAGIYDLGYFIKKASNVLFLKDSEWLLHQSEQVILNAG